MIYMICHALMNVMHLIFKFPMHSPSRFNQSYCNHCLNNFSMHWLNSIRSLLLWRKSDFYSENINFFEINDFILNIIPGDKPIYLSNDFVSTLSEENDNVNVLYPYIKLALKGFFVFST